MSVGVYVLCKNEENLIGPCVKSLLRVYPQTCVIDLCSRDSTVEKVKELGVSYQIVSCDQHQYPNLKNELSKLNEWTFFVDGDEIYPESSLLKLEELRKSNVYLAYRISWKFLKYSDNKLYVSSKKPNGTKLYYSSKYTWKRKWPKEVLCGSRKNEKRKEPEGINGVWCWHGKLLPRTSAPHSCYEDAVRDVKKQWYSEQLEKNEDITWKELIKLPWE